MKKIILSLFCLLFNSLLIAVDWTGFHLADTYRGRQCASLEGGLVWEAGQAGGETWHQTGRNADQLLTEVCNGFCGAGNVAATACSENKGYCKCKTEPKKN